MFTKARIQKAGWMGGGALAAVLCLVNATAAPAQEIDDDVVWVDETAAATAASEAESAVELTLDDADKVADSDPVIVDKLEAMEKVHGADTRKIVSDTTKFPYCVVGRIKGYSADGQWVYSGTGTLIGYKTVLTAAHVLVDGGAWITDITFTPGKKNESRPFGSVQVTKKQMKRAYFDSEDPNYDVALMTLAEPIGKQIGYMWIAKRTAAYFRDGTTVNTAGYPSDRSDGQVMYHASGPAQGTTANGVRFHHWADTYGGQSGSPVWLYFSSDDSRRLVGVHVSGGTTYNEAVRISDYWFDWINDYLKENDSIYYPSSSGSSSSGGSSGGKTGGSTSSKPPSNSSGSTGISVLPTPSGSMCGAGSVGPMSVLFLMLAGHGSLRRGRRST